MLAEIRLEGRNIAGSVYDCNEDRMHESMLKLSNEFGFSSETYFQVSGLYLWIAVTVSVTHKLSGIYLGCVNPRDRLPSPAAQVN